MLRLSLQDLALRIKILKVNIGSSVEEVLSRALDPPSSINIQRALSALVEVKALTPGEEITPLGRLLSKLPMDVHLGKFLLVAALFKCLDPALTIAATLNSKSPFVTPFGLEQAADVAKRGFAEGESVICQTNVRGQRFFDRGQSLRQLETGVGRSGVRENILQKKFCLATGISVVYMQLISEFAAD